MVTWFQIFHSYVNICKKKQKTVKEISGNTKPIFLQAVPWSRNVFLPGLHKFKSCPLLNLNIKTYFPVKSDF